MNFKNDFYIPVPILEHNFTLNTTKWQQKSPWSGQISCCWLYVVVRMKSGLFNLFEVMKWKKLFVVAMIFKHVAKLTLMWCELWCIDFKGSSATLFTYVVSKLIDELEW